MNMNRAAQITYFLLRVVSGFLFLQQPDPNDLRQHLKEKYDGEA